MILPGHGSSVRRELDQWFAARKVHPRAVAEVEDSALAKLFAQHGHGMIATTAVLEEDVRTLYGLEAVGRLETVVERFYAITVERKISHPAVAAICRDARRELFSTKGAAG